MSDLFIGESDAEEEENPLALSSHASDGSEWDDDDDEGPGGHKKAVSLSTGRRLLDMVATALKVFDDNATRIAPNPYLSVAAPPQSGTYKVAGFARIRARLAAEHRHIVECIGGDNLGNLRGNNVSALCLTVALMCTQPDVSAAMYRVNVPSFAQLRAREERAAAAAAAASPAADAAAAVDEQVEDDDEEDDTTGSSPKRSVEVDLITDGGQRWVKVKASSPSNFTREAAGVIPGQPAPRRGEVPELGTAPFLDTLRLLLAAARSPNHRLPFNQRPKIVIACAEEPPAVVRQVITDLSPDLEILVMKDIGCGPRALFHEQRAELVTAAGQAKLLRPLRGSGYPVQRVNLDVTAMVALVCDCCHGFAGQVFPKHHILQQQSRDEAEGQHAVAKFIAPALAKFTQWADEPPVGAATDTDTSAAPELVDADGAPVQHPITNDPTDPSWTKWPVNWIAAKRAVEEFTWILDTIAGDHELVRAAWLLRRIQVFDDTLPQYASPAVTSLRTTNKIQERHRAVFGLGDAMRAITITGNRTFVQAAQEQGVSLLVQFHPSRALTERKRRGVEGRRNNDFAGPPPSVAITKARSATALTAADDGTAADAA